MGSLRAGSSEARCGFLLRAPLLVILEAPRSVWSAERLRVERSLLRGTRLTEVSGTRVVELLFEGGKLAISNRTVGDAGFEAALRWSGG